MVRGVVGEGSPQHVPVGLEALMTQPDLINEDALAAGRCVPGPFPCPTTAGFVVDETSEADVISRGWIIPGWSGHKRPIMVFGRHKLDGWHFRGPLGPKRGHEPSCPV